jgi:hypothetical protein
MESSKAGVLYGVPALRFAWPFALRPRIDYAARRARRKYAEVANPLWKPPSKVAAGFSHVGRSALREISGGATMIAPVGWIHTFGKLCSDFPVSSSRLLS